MSIGVFGSLSITTLVIGLIIFLPTYYQPKNIRRRALQPHRHPTTKRPRRRVSYNLTIHMTLYNPSVRVNIYYDALDASLLLVAMDDDHTAFFSGPTTSTRLAETYQHQKTSDALEVSFDGRGIIVAGDMGAQLHKDIVDNGAVSFELVMLAHMRYRSGPIKTQKKASIRCPLKIPVVVNKRRHGGGVVADGLLSPGGRCNVKY
ncbi:unnamed protein product [Urochloa humidicola]